MFRSCLVDWQHVQQYGYLSSVGSVALLVARRTNDRKVAGSRPTKVVCITVLTVNRMGGELPAVAGATPSSEL